jgi:hypothetical protein
MPQTQRTPGAGQASGGSSRVIAATELSIRPTDDIPRVRAYAAPPCPGRGLWLVVVLTCSHCGTAHSHRVGDHSRLLSGDIDKACPATGLWYRLAPVQRRNQARRTNR